MNIKNKCITILFALSGLFSQHTAVSRYCSFAKQLAFGAFQKSLKPLNKVNKEWSAIYQSAERIPLESRAQKFKTDHPKFMFGLSNSDYQIGGRIGEETSFDRWAKNQNKEVAGTALDFWNNYKSIIKDVASTGSKMFRVSLSWERLQPHGPHEWNNEAMQRYVDIIKCIKEHGMEPLVVFHHYTIPTWFEDLGGKYLGGFTDEKNNHYFVEYAARMYDALAPYVTYFSTCNLGYEFKAYTQNDLAPGILYYVALYIKNNPVDFKQIQSFFPSFCENKTENDLIEILAQICTQKTAQRADADMPIYIQNIISGIKSLQKKYGLQIAHQVKANILKAHVDIYRAIHKIHATKKVGNKPKLGIQTTIHPIYPKNSYNILDILVATVGEWQLNHGLYQFFTNDTYDLVMPQISLTDRKPGAHKCLDWIGINVYDRSMVNHKLKMSKEPGKETASDKVETPEAIATAVEEVYKKLVSPLEKKIGKEIPIIITENGIAPKSKDTSIEEQNAQRNRYFSRTICTIDELLKRGYPVIAYTPWSSHDNFEWGKKYGSSRYGMFYVDGFNTNNVKTTLKDPENNFFVRFCRLIA